VRLVALAGACALLAVAPALAGAQQRPVRPPTPPPAGAPVRGAVSVQPGAPGADSTARDSTRADRVQWAEPDSVMAALLAREGYTVTRYQGDSVHFDARQRQLALEGSPAAVERAGSMLVGDTVIYDDSLDRVTVRGDTVVLRDPARGSDVVASGYLVYDLEERRGVVREVRTSTQTGGETWYLHGRGPSAVELPDSTGRGSASFYARGGEITSCNLTEPHYHFRSGEIKVVRDRVLIARPAILYIADIPVAWLPFIFQDLRSGRRSGILTPRFGVSDIVRNSPTYRRHIEDLGYYFNLGDYMDLELALDWRSGARPSDGDPGWMRYRAQWRYRWLDRFISGDLRTEYHTLRDGRKNTSVSLGHSQDFSQNTHLRADINYMTSTRVRQQTSTNPFEQLATIYSSLNYSTKMGPASLSLGGTQRQFPGQDQIDRSFPTFSLSTTPISPVSWLVWTPSLRVGNSEQLRLPRPGGIGFRYITRPDGTADSVAVEGDRRQTTLSFDTPLRIFGFTWSNSFAVNDRENAYPQLVDYYRDVADTTSRVTSVFARTYTTSVDWTTGFSLPPLAQGTWNLVPSVSIQNVDPGGGFLVRTELSGGDFVRQSKRLVYGVSASPTFFGLFPGIGPFSRFRHAISPTLSYGYSPRASVGDDFLRALGRSREGYLGALPQNSLSLGLNTNLEAKRRSDADSAAAPEGGSKLRLLSLDFDGVGYDWERYRELRNRAAEAGRGSVPWYRGVTNSTFGWRATSELLPGFSFRTGYSLYEGNPLSDTARFKPFHTNTDINFSLDRNRNPLLALARVFGVAVPRAEPLAETTEPTVADTFAQRVSRQPIAGAYRRGDGTIPTGQGWTASFNYSSSRQRPVTGGNVVEFDPEAACAGFVRGTPSFDRCVEQETAAFAPDDETDRSTTILRSPPTRSLQSAISFNVTPLWAMSWSTTYDLVRSEFASHIVSLQRDMHDWRAVFAFTQAANGNFAFNFFIALKAEPDLKFDYNRNTYRGRR
jgi:hypothetical protein